MGVVIRGRWGVAGYVSCGKWELHSIGFAGCRGCKVWELRCERVAVWAALVWEVAVLGMRCWGFEVWRRLRCGGLAVWALCRLRCRWVTVALWTGIFRDDFLMSKSTPSNLVPNLKKFLLRPSSKNQKHIATL